MNNAGMSDAEKIVSDKLAEEGATAAGWAQSFVGQLGSRLKNAGAKLQEASVPSTSSSPKTSFPKTSSPKTSFPKTSAAEPERPATDRAEESLDRAGERIGLFAATLSHRVRRSAALVREEAEDVLAEAQSLRRKDG